MTVVFPVGRVLPEGHEYVTGGFAVTLSVAVAGEYVTGAPAGSVASTTRSAGQVISGGVWSTTASVTVATLLSRPQSRAWKVKLSGPR